MARAAWRVAMEQELEAWATSEDWDEYDVANEACNVVAHGRSWDDWGEQDSWQACLEAYGSEKKAREAYGKAWTQWHREWLEANRDAVCDWDIDEVLAEA